MSTDDDLSWLSSFACHFFTAARGDASCPMLLVVRSNSPYSTTTCLLKCIMSLSVARMTRGNVIYYVNTWWLCVRTRFTLFFFFLFFPHFGQLLFYLFLYQHNTLLNGSDAIFSQQMWWMWWSVIVGLSVQTELENCRVDAVFFWTNRSLSGCELISQWWAWAWGSVRNKAFLARTYTKLWLCLCWSNGIRVMNIYVWSFLGTNM